MTDKQKLKLLVKKLRDMGCVFSVRQRNSGGKLYVKVGWRMGERTNSVRDTVLAAFPGAVATSGVYNDPMYSRTWRLNP